VRVTSHGCFGESEEEDTRVTNSVADTTAQLKAMNPNQPNPRFDPNPTFDEKAAELARDAKEGIKNAGEELKEKAADVADATREKFSEVGERVGDAAKSLREKASEKFSDLRDGAADLYERTSARVRTMGEDGVEFVRDNPISTVLTVFAAGILLGYTLRR
jgi:ElaB/YqjD/DUF883 family membrane-anchored ribosome-binding protein